LRTAILGNQRGMEIALGVIALVAGVVLAILHLTGPAWSLLLLGAALLAMTPVRRADRAPIDRAENPA
jgi:hypothetical protein